MTLKLDLVGKRFGKLTVTSIGEKNKGGRFRWLCLCDCGNEIPVRGCSLKVGKTRSCGCSRYENRSGFSKSPIYTIFQGMKRRCYDVSNSNYQYYGGRGIKVCDRWLESFGNFNDDMLPSWEEGLQLDRVDVEGDYSKENCRWVTLKQNNFNKRGHANTTSKYKGVHWDKVRGKWLVKININGTRINLGAFDNEDDAATAYNIKAVELFGIYAYINPV